MTNRKPPPLFSGQNPNVCPVCGEVSYSASGVHPQCSAKKADEERMKFIKAEQSKTKKSPAKSTESRWQKSCPRCSRSQHVRKKTCLCGYKFPVK
jgi:ribosomal protein S14